MALIDPAYLEQALPPGAPDPLEGVAPYLENDVQVFYASAFPPPPEPEDDPLRYYAGAVNDQQDVMPRERHRASSGRYPNYARPTQGEVTAS